jgi:GAF domain-containing protein
MTDRELLIADAFVELADTLVDDFDLVDFLNTVVERAVDLVGAQAGGIMLSDQRGGMEVMAASSHATRLVELFEIQNEEGPCLDAFRTGRAVTRDSPAEMAASWPAFTPRLAEAGFSSAQAVPMRLRTEVIGALNLFRTAPGALSEAEMKLVQALADVATVGILQQRAVMASSLLAEQLQSALHSRVLIEQAKGIIAERAGTDIDRAFDMIRRHARRTGTPLQAVVARVIDGSLRPPLG